MLLNLIKQLQYNYISKNSLTKDNKNKKEKLIELKDILSNILDRKSKIYNSNKKEIEEKKDKINKKILLDSEEDNNCVNYAKELEQLRLNEFSMENEIKKFDNEIKEKSMLSNYESKYSEKSSSKKIFYDQLKKNKLSSLEILREEKKDFQQQLIDLTIKKSEQESEINSIKMKISKIKNKIKEKKVEKFEISQDCSDNKDYKIVKRNNNKRI